jgi:putative DNA primase/helicase
VPDAYLQGHGIEYVPPNAMVLTAEDSARLTGKDGRPGRRFPAMLLPVIRDGLLVGVHVTWLSPDRKTKVATKGQARLTYGLIGGGYIPLAPTEPDRPLVVGEGVETTLSAMALANAPGIALISTGNFKSADVPKCSEILIAADNDEPGRKAAAQLAERLEYEGRKVRIALPPLLAGNEKADWNDRLQHSQNAAEEWRAALEADAPPDWSGPVSALTEETFMALTFPKRELFLAPWLPRAGLVMIHAPKGEGKTWFSLPVGKAVAAGNEIMGWSCPGSGRVLYMDGAKQVSTVAAGYVSFALPRQLSASKADDAESGRPGRSPRTQPHYRSMQGRHGNPR